jgi:hypothetical protein
MHWQAGFAIHAVAGFDHVVLYVAANPVLWTKERSQLNVSVVVREVSSMTIRVIDGGLIADQSDARASKHGMAFFK